MLVFFQTLSISLPSSRKSSLINLIFLIVAVLNVPLFHLSYSSPAFIPIVLASALYAGLGQPKTLADWHILTRLPRNLAVPG